MKLLCVARHDEPLDWIGVVPDEWMVQVHNKGGVITPARPCVVMMTMENVGREAETWCRAIRDAMYCLPDALACVQGDCEKHLREGFRMPPTVDDPDWASRKFQGLAHYLEGFNGDYQAIGPWVWTAPDGRPDHFGLPMDAAYRYVFNLRCPDRVRFHAWAQFIVGRDRLMRVDAGALERMRIMATEWRHGPWLCERLWPTLFGVEGATT